MTVGYLLVGILRLALCIYGLVRTNLRLTFGLWSVAAFLSLAVSLFTAFQQRLVAGVGAFPFLSYLWPVAAAAEYVSLALDLAGLLALVRAANIKSNDT